MSDTAGRKTGNNDPLEDAAKRAEMAVNKSESDPGGASYGTGFGEIDLGGDSQTPDLDLAEPAPKKPNIAKPALLQDEQWEDDAWANDQPGMAPVENDKPQATSKESTPSASKTEPKAQKLRRAALPPKQGTAQSTAQAQAQEQVQQVPEEKQGPFIRVSRAQGPKKDWGPMIKWVSIVLVAAACIAGAFIGYSKWQEGVKAEQQAQLDALNQGSLQSLKSKAVKKGKLGT